jgi:hypothetical protein
VSRLTTLPHQRGTPARRAVIPGMPIPRLDPEAGLARGCGEGAHQESSSKRQNSSSAQRTASPPTGYSFGPRPLDHLLAAGLGSRRLTLHRPFPSQIGGIMAVSPAPLAGGGAFIAGAPALTPSLAGWCGTPAAATSTSGILMDGWGDPGAPPTPVPSLQYCDWRLRDSSPGMASASMGSISLCLLLTSSSFCPSSFFWESLGRSPFPGRPFYPFHPGLPRCPGFGATGGRRFPPSLFGRGMMELSPSPLRR